MFQYEIAYDQNITGTSFPGFALEWDAKWASVSQITLNGTQTGDIKGYVGDLSAGIFNFNNFLQTSSATIMGAHGYGVYLQGLNPQFGKYTETVGNAVDGVVKGFFNAVLGGTVTSQPINLTINTRIKLNGSIVTNGGVINKKLILPGQSNSQTADGNTPYYNQPMGVMNISNPPIVNLLLGYEMNGPVSDPWGNDYYENAYSGTFTLDNNSFSILWNPSIINSSPAGATI